MILIKRFLAFILLCSFIVTASSLFTFAKESQIGNTSAKSACLIEAESGKVLYSKNSNLKMPMASTTKIMTAIIALESSFSLNSTIKVPSEAVGIEGSSVYLKQGEQVSFEFLLYALMLSSANDAAVAIAHTVSGSVYRFVSLMNEKAKSLGLSNTHFTNPHGLYADDHYTTAEDLAKIMAYAMKNTDFAKITSVQKIAFSRDDGTSFLLNNHNRLLKTYDGVIGGKTGFTKKSGRCLVTCAERDGLRLIAVTLHAPNDWDDHSKLYDFGFDNYERITFDPQLVIIPVISGNQNEVSAYSDAFSILTHKDHGDISIRINAPKFLFAKIKKGEQVGKIYYFCDGRIIATSPLYASTDIEKTNYQFNLIDWFIDLFKRIFK